AGARRSGPVWLESRARTEKPGHAPRPRANIRGVGIGRADNALPMRIRARCRGSVDNPAAFAGHTPPQGWIPRTRRRDGTAPAIRTVPRGGTAASPDTRL